jgi:curved DNA-binding protein
VKGGDLYYDLELDPWDTVLGTKVEIPTLDGSVRLTIPEGTTSNRQFRIKGKGLPSTKGTTGDLYAEVRIRIPHTLNEAQRTAWEKLKASHS